MNQIIKILVVFLIIFVIYKTIKNMNAFNETDFADAIAVLKTRYPADICKQVEQMYRKETNNFKSVQYKKTGSAGMEAHSKIFPYGWLLFKDSWIKNPNSAPNETIYISENQTGIKKPFLAFRSVLYAADALARYIIKYGAGRWYSTNETAANKYMYELSLINTKYA